MTSQSRAIRCQSRKIVKSGKIMAQTFLNCVSTFDLTDVLGSIYDRKTAARPFDTIYDILRSLSVAQSLLKGQNSPIWRVGNRGVKFPARRSVKKDAVLISMMRRAGMTKTQYRA